MFRGVYIDISARHQWAPVIWGPPFQFLYPGADSQVSHARSTSWRRTCQWCRWRSSSSPGPSGGNWLPKSNWEKGCPPWNWTLWLGRITNVAVPGEPAGSVCQPNLKKSDHGESAQKCKWSSYQEWMIIPRGQWDLTNYHGQLCSSWKWWALNGWSGCTPVSFRCQKQWFSLELQHQCGYGSKTFQNEVLYNGLGKVVWAILHHSEIVVVIILSNTHSKKNLVFLGFSLTKRYGKPTGFHFGKSSAQICLVLVSI